MAAIFWTAFVVLALALVPVIVKILKHAGEETKPLTEEDENGDPVFLPVEGDKTLHTLLLGAAALGYGALTALALATWDVLLVDMDLLKFNLGFLFLLPALGHAFLQFKNVPEDKLGALYFYGRALRNAGAGLHFAPFMRLETDPRDVQKIWAPGKRDEIFWKDEKEDLPKDMVRPIFMNTRAPGPGEDKPLDTQMTVGVAYALFWRISDLLTFRAHTRSASETEDQLRSISEAVLAEEIAKRTVDGSIAGQEEINQIFDNRIRKRTEGWGVEVMRANLTQINPSHELAIAMRDRAKAKFTADTEVIVAKGEAEAIVLRGEAQGKADKARQLGPLEGRAEGYQKIAEAIGVSGESVQAAETLREALPETTVVVGTQGITDLLGLVKAGSEALAKGKKRSSQS